MWACVIAWVRVRECVAKRDVQYVSVSGWLWLRDNVWVRSSVWEWLRVILGPWACECVTGSVRVSDRVTVPAWVRAWYECECVTVCECMRLRDWARVWLRGIPSVWLSYWVRKWLGRTATAWLCNSAWLDNWASERVRGKVTEWASDLVSGRRWVSDLLNYSVNV